MLSSKPTELAKQLSSELESIKGRLALLEQRLQEYGLFELSKSVATIAKQVETLTGGSDTLIDLGKSVAVLEDRVNKLEKRDEEASKRGWQFVYIIVGAVLALGSSFLVQLVFYFLKK